MKKGKRVVCVNDKFEPEIAKLYQALPKLNEVYTVREVTLGREHLLKFGQDGRWVSGGASDESLTVRILLEELINNVDFTHTKESRSLDSMLNVSVRLKRTRTPSSMLSVPATLGHWLRRLSDMCDNLSLHMSHLNT